MCWFTNRCLISIKIILAAILFCGLVPSGFAADAWQNVEDGLSYQDLNSSMLKPWTHIHAFKINPRQYRFESINAKSMDKKAATVDGFAEKSQALIAVNGGFFDHQYRSLGLRISNHQRKNPLKRISWWGVFYIANEQPYIKSAYQFYPQSNIDFAIQSGPRLIIDGKIPSLKPGIAERTALCIDDNKNVIVLVTDNYAMSTHDLAELMRKPPLNCYNALNLDGGKSTQLYARIKDFNVGVSGFTQVGDAVIIKKK